MNKIPIQISFCARHENRDKLYSHWRVSEYGGEPATASGVLCKEPGIHPAAACAGWTTGAGERQGDPRIALPGRRDDRTVKERSRLRKRPESDPAPSGAAMPVRQRSDPRLKTVGLASAQP